MKKYLCICLALVLLVTTTFFPAQAETVSTNVVVVGNGSASPIAYTSDFESYDSIVGTLNSDGTKTAYIFASAEDAAMIDSITGLVSPSESTNQSSTTNSSFTSNSITDATVYSGAPDTNFGSETLLNVGEYNGYKRIYLKVSFSAINALANTVSYKNLLSASLNFNYQGTLYDDLQAVYEAYLVKSTWSETGITWNNRPDYYSEIIGMSNAYKERSEGSYIQDFYITKVFMAWMQGMSNYGIMIKEKDDKYQHSFHSTESGTQGFRPYLAVTYTTDVAPTGQGITESQSYYIVNRQTGQCLTASSTVSGSDVQVRTGNTAYADRQKWKFTALSTGQYLIQVGTTGNYLCNDTSGNAYVGDGVAAPYNTWTVERNWNGTYRFGNTNSLLQYLTTDNDNVYSAGDVFQGNYTCNMEHFDEWSLVPADLGTAVFMGMQNDEDITTTYGMETMANALGQRNYTAEAPLINQPASVGFEKLQNNDIFYFYQHGLPGQLLFYSGPTTGGGTTSSIVVSGEGDYSLSTINPNALARLRLAFLFAYETGRDYNDDNMTGKLYWLGCHNVISHFHKAGNEAGEIWSSAFMTNLLLGRSLGNAKSRADRYVYHDMSRLSLSSYVFDANVRHELGDDTYRPCYDMATQSQTLAYQYNDEPQLTYTLTRPASQPTTTPTIYIEDSIPYTAVAKQFTLPVTYGHYDTDSRIFDVYMDNDGGIYWYYTGTNTLHSYEPYTENLSLGDCVVDPDDALGLAEMFLDITGYDYYDFTVTTSNPYSKNYTIEYRKESQDLMIDHQRLVFHMQADEDGYAYITDFTAYDYTGE